MDRLHKNQVMALKNTFENVLDDKYMNSGIHFHATGTGKSWIALETALRFDQGHILWLCEQKSILSQQFDRTILKERGYFEALHKKYLVIDYASYKAQSNIGKWYDLVNQATVWNKPILLVINRTYLVYNENYKKLRLNFGLIIHDECHSITNPSTHAFYRYIYNDYGNERITRNMPYWIGFSATPLMSITQSIPEKEIMIPIKYDKNDDCNDHLVKRIVIPDGDRVLSKYSIYDAFMENKIVKPKIMWMNSVEPLTQREILRLCECHIKKLAYRKVIFWCGIIKLAKEMCSLWKNAFPNYICAVDTSESDKVDDENYDKFEEFYEAKENAFLFCAAKHREGSDIPFLDGCVFLDKVRSRTPRLFVQCLGRVLRLDNQYNKKQYGLIIDVRAKSVIEMSDRMNQYINPSGYKKFFPWNYTYSHIRINKKVVKYNFLDLRKPDEELSTIENDLNKKLEIKEENKEFGGKITREMIKSKFIIKPPKSKEYEDRIERELDMIVGKDLGDNIMIALDILEMTKSIPHVTRGSCGSSLVCYLLGISHVDPIKYDISFARFLNIYRKNLPDIDFDFPHMMRDEVFIKLELKWPGKVARISNHIHFHEKSALREAMRRNGVTGFIGKYEIYDKLRTLPIRLQRQVKKDADELEETFRGYSLHCGGVIFYSDGVPEEDILQTKRDGKRTLSQVVFDKHDVADKRSFKVDILSSRALSQLWHANNYNAIDFYGNHDDKETSELISRGDNIGITLAESPLMRKAMIKLRPKTVDDVAACMAIIRPTAKDARDALIPPDLSKEIIYDDDAIRMITTLLECDEDKADMYRRAFAKRDKVALEELRSNLPKEKHYILKKLECLRKYGFCKAHAYSYAQLVWQLAYQKAHNPKGFWRGALKNCASFYKKWVHLYEAHSAGIDIEFEKSKQDRSIFSEARNKSLLGRTALEQLRNKGYWDFKKYDFVEDCYCFEKKENVYFNGIIACSRLLDRNKDTATVVMSMCVGNHKYIEVTVTGKIGNISKMVGCKGMGKADKEQKDLNIQSFKFEFY